MFSTRSVTTLVALAALAAAVAARAPIFGQEPVGTPHNGDPATELPNEPVSNHAWKNTGSSYISLDADLSKRLGTGGFTIEAWVYSENPSAPRDQVIVSHSEPGADSNFKVDFKLQLNRNNGRVAFLMGAGSELGFSLVGRTLQFNEWTHIAVTVAAPAAGDPTSARLYINGELVASADAWIANHPGSRQLSSAPIEIGRGMVGNEPSYFVGSIDEVRFWSTVRSQAMIERYMRDPFLFSDPVEIPADLIAYYSFDAGPDDVVWDNSDQPWYDGQPMNGQQRVVADGVVNVPLSPLYAPFAGPEAFGLSFTGVHGSQNAVKLPVALSRELPRGFTFEAWIYLTASDRVDHHYKNIVSRFNQQAADAQPGTFASGSNPEADFVFQVDPRNGRLVFFMGGGRSASCMDSSLGYGIALFSSGQYNIKAYEWAHVAFTIISSDSGAPFSAKMYVNGAEVPQSDPALPGNDWRTECTRNYLRFDPIWLGFYDNGIEQYWEGRIDEVRIWDEPRDDADLARDYLRPVSAATPSLLAYYLPNDGSGVNVKDSTTHMYHGLAVRPAWILSAAPAELVEATSGFPLHLALRAQSPAVLGADGAISVVYPNSDTFRYVVTHLPSSGGLFINSAPIELLEQADVDNFRVVPDQLTYQSDIGFVGYDYFGYAAISNSTGLMSETHYVYLDVQKYSGHGCSFVDACGVCEGDGMSCVGGCDGKGGVFDVCGVCAGDASSCTCVYYKTFKTDELDCILLQRALNATIDTIEQSIETLQQTLSGLATLPQSCWRNGFFDLATQLDFLTDDACVGVFEGELSEFETEVSGELQSCDYPQAPIVV